MSNQALRRLQILSEQLSPRPDLPYSLYSFGGEANSQLSTFFNALLQAMKLPCQFRLHASKSLSDVLQLLRSRTCLGACLEGQFRTAVLPLLDVVEAGAREIGVVDVVIKQGSQLIGINSQLLALISIIENAPEFNSKRNAVILGCGEDCKTALCALRRVGLLDITIYSDSMTLLRKLPWPRKTTESLSLDPVDIAVICQAGLPFPPLRKHALVIDLTEQEGYWGQDCRCYGAEDLRAWRLWLQVRELTNSISGLTEYAV